MEFNRLSLKWPNNLTRNIFMDSERRERSLKSKHIRNSNNVLRITKLGSKKLHLTVDINWGIITSFPLLSVLYLHPYSAGAKWRKYRSRKLVVSLTRYSLRASLNLKRFFHILWQCSLFWLFILTFSRNIY